MSGRATTTAARRPPRAALVVVAALGVTGIALAADWPAGLFPPLPDPARDALLPDDVRDDAAPVLGASTTGARALALRASALHERAFFVADVVRPDAARTLFVVPQYHRSPTSPILFTSLGAAVREVQDHVAVLVTHLARTQGLACVGTEGDVADLISGPADIDRIAWSLRDLRIAARDARVVVVDDAEADDAVDALVVVLEAAARDHARTLDGVGMAQARLDGERPLARFGVEDPALLARALTVAGELDEVERELARLRPPDPGGVDDDDPLMALVLEEYPLYAASTLVPYRDAVRALEARRELLVKRGDTELAVLLTRLLARARRLAEVTIRPDDVDALFAHYRAVADRVAPTPAAPAATPKPDARKLRTLEARRRALEATHGEITRDARERFAVTRVRARIPDDERAAPVCALVMGAHHERGLLRALDEASDVGVVVVRPFPPEDAPPAE